MHLEQEPTASTNICYLTVTQQPIMPYAIYWIHDRSIRQTSILKEAMVPLTVHPSDDKMHATGMPQNYLFTWCCEMNLLTNMVHDLKRD